MLNADDTIVAVSSAAGAGALAIVRLSGPDALALANGAFRCDCGDLRTLGAFRAVEGVVSFLAVGGAAISLPCRLYVFRAPRSFTRQDVLELHVPGSPVAVAALADHFIHAGARRAQAGEFTARAFFSGRIDLSAAQAVADVIDAASDAQLRSAMSALGGRLAKLCAAAASELAEVLATTEASIDLAEEHIELDSPKKLAGRLTRVSDELDRLARQASDMPERAHLPRAALCGPPNAGKSSLLNALAGWDRAIVSPIAGTTRDVLTTTIFLEGSAVLLQDAAGLEWTQPHKRVPPSSGCLLEGEGTLQEAAHQAARAAIDAADVLLFVADINDCSGPADITRLAESFRASNRRAPALVLANKADLLTEDKIAAGILSLRQATGIASIATSATSGRGLDELRHRLAELLNLHAGRTGEALGLHRWQRQCVVAAEHATRRAIELLEASDQVADQAELVAVELREALGQLGQISGQIVTEDILGRIFARFCVGK